MFEVTQRQCPQGSIEYTIRAGDTPYDIAARYNTIVDEILAVNPGMNPNSLMIDDVICVPVREEPVHCPRGSRRYTIRSGDTLGDIAVRFNVRVEEIIRLNPSIDPRGLRVGQIICVPTMAPPGRCPEGSTPYIIKPGDTLYDVAQRHGSSVDDIVNANPGLNPDRLVIGERICIPRR